jgi:hypothetical protein
MVCVWRGGGISQRTPFARYLSQSRPRTMSDEQEAKKQKTDEPAAEAGAAASSAGGFVAGEASGVKGAAPSTPDEVAAAIKRQVPCARCTACAAWRDRARAWHACT